MFNPEANPSQENALPLSPHRLVDPQEDLVNGSFFSCLMHRILLFSPFPLSHGKELFLLCSAVSALKKGLTQSRQERKEDNNNEETLCGLCDLARKLWLFAVDSPRFNYPSIKPCRDLVVPPSFRGTNINPKWESCPCGNSAI
jgi:hypothetical protein